MITEITKVSEFSKGFLLISKENCNPCKMVYPKYQKLSTLADKCHQIKLESEEGRELAELHNIRTVPSLIYLGTNVTSKASGMSNVSKFLDELIKEHSK